MNPNKKQEKTTLIQFMGKKHYLQYPGKLVWLDLSSAFGMCFSKDKKQIRNLSILNRVCAASVAICLSPETNVRLDADINDYKYDLIEYGDKVLAEMLEKNIGIDDIQQAALAILNTMPSLLDKEVKKTENFTNATQQAS